jgi:hypothetical protein
MPRVYSSPSAKNRRMTVLLAELYKHIQIVKSVITGKLSEPVTKLNEVGLSELGGMAKVWHVTTLRSSVPHDASYSGCQR